MLQPGDSKLESIARFESCCCPRVLFRKWRFYAIASPSRYQTPLSHEEKGLVDIEYSMCAFQKVAIVYAIASLVPRPHPLARKRVW